MNYECELVDGVKI